MDPVRELAATRPGLAAMTPAAQTQATPLNDFIYMSTGTSNAYMVVTKAGRVIVNTGMGWEAPTHKSVFDAVCPGPTPWIVATQGHVDHLGGVALFRETGSQFIAQANNRACQRDDERIAGMRMAMAHTWFGSVIDQAMELAASQPELFRQDRPEPDVTFDHDYRFELGGVQFELISTPGGETMDSCVLWLPQQRIAFSGNMVGPLFPHFPNFNTLRGDKYRFVEPYLESVRRLRELGPKMLITGHFEPIHGDKLIARCLDRLHDAVDYVHRETLAGMNQGLDVHTLMRQVQLPSNLALGQGYGKVSWAVRTIWEGYVGWFHQRATSELYPCPGNAIHPELVALAGVDAVLARAREALAESKTEIALQLVEAVLEHSPEHPDGLALQIQVHRQLLSEVQDDNFWESGWLRTQIAKLEQRLADTT